jgi:hypothetical protein
MLKDEKYNTVLKGPSMRISWQGFLGDLGTRQKN